MGFSECSTVTCSNAHLLAQKRGIASIFHRPDPPGEALPIAWLEAGLIACTCMQVHALTVLNGVFLWNSGALVLCCMSVMWDQEFLSVGSTHMHAPLLPGGRDSQALGAPFSHEVIVIHKHWGRLFHMSMSTPHASFFIFPLGIRLEWEFPEVCLLHAGLCVLFLHEACQCLTLLMPCQVGPTHSPLRPQPTT